MTLALRYVAHSEIGLVRKNNQDSAYVSPTMLVVADGMGGAAAGDLASAVAIRELRNVDGDHTEQDMLAALEAAITQAGAQISDLIASDPALDGMGSTVCGVMFDGTSLGVANIGDSRAYRLRDGVLTRLTHDHSWVQTLVDEGRITEAEALEHPHRSLILRVINGQPQHVPDLELTEVHLGDRLMVCSDGLCGMVTDAAIEAHLGGERETALNALVALAHAAGGLDNITIIVADVVEGERSGPAEVLGAAASLDLEAPFDTVTAPLHLPDEDGEGPRPDPAAGEDARYAPTAERPRWAWVKLALALALPLALIAAGIGMWYSYTRTQYFVGANGPTVAIFRGVPDQVLHLPLSEVVENDSTLLADLPTTYRDQVNATIPSSSLEAAQRTVYQLRDISQICLAVRHAREQASATPAPSPSPSGSQPASPATAPATATTTATATATTTAKTTARATATTTAKTTAPATATPPTTAAAPSASPSVTASPTLTTPSTDFAGC